MDRMEEEELFIIDLFLEGSNSSQAALTKVNLCYNNIDLDVIQILSEIEQTTFIKLESTGASVKDFYSTIIKLSDQEFREHFRMSRHTMQMLVDEICRNIPDEVKQNMIVPLEKKIYVTIWTLANKDSYREIGNLFGLHKSSVCQIFHEICEVIANLRFDYVRWPSEHHQELTKEYIFRQHGFPNCIGFVDGCHIQILGPANNPVDYYNRKEVHSIILQAVCNENLEFINIHLGHTGRAHDARVFRESQLNQELVNLVDCESHILGDSAYTLSPRLLTPYRDNGHLTNSQRKYNKVHASSRAYIERSFGRLKGKFRRLKYLELHKTENATIVVAAACVLHNFILNHEPFVNIEQNELLLGRPAFNLQNLTGAEKRNLISDFISRQ